MRFSLSGIDPSLYIVRAAWPLYLFSDVRLLVEQSVNLKRKELFNPFLFKLTPQRTDVSAPSILKMDKVGMETDLQ